jgi:hypothetical protein
MHVCTWKRCGAPATKKVRIRLRYPERILGPDRKPLAEAGEGKDLWRCDPHYEEEKGRWKDDEDLFIVEW